MADPEVQVTEPVIPAGEGETQPVETTEVAAVSTEESAPLTEEQEMDALEADLRKAETPEAKAEVQSKINKRFNAVTKKRYEAELQLAELKGRLGALDAQRVPEKAAEPLKPPELVLPAKPKRSEFIDEETGLVDEEALDTAKEKWLRDVTKLEVKHELEIEAQKSQATKWQSEKESWLQAGREKFEGFDEAFKVVSAKAADSLGPALTESDMSHELTNYLGKNPKELSRLSSLSPFKAAIEIGKIEEKLKKPEPKKTTTAAAPIVPISPGSTDVTKKPLAELPMADYYKRRTEELRSGK